VIGTIPRFLTFEPGETVLHRLDPRTKLAGTVVLTADALLASVPRGIAVSLIFAAAQGLLVRELLPSLWRLMRPLFLFLILFGLLVVVTTPGHALAHIWFIVPTRDGVDLAIRLGLEVLVIAYTTSLLTLTTPPLALAGAMEWMLGFLARVKVPVRDIIAMVTIGLTFVPLLLTEAQRVIAAQRARGANISANALLADEQSLGALLIPLLLANLRRGNELAESMEARLFNTGPRTSLHVYHFGRNDLLTAIVLAIVTALVVGLSFVPL
jgi:energy-coupling factor transport system permease protein